MPSELALRYGAESAAMAERGLPPAVSVRIIALLFGYSGKFVGSLSTAPRKHYRTFLIPKGRRRRTIRAPRVALKLIQRWIGFHLERSIAWPGHVTGFVTGRSHLTAVKAHTDAQWVYSVDIENFFPSVSRARVRYVLESLGYSSHASETISSLVCFDDALAQGSPSSPTLANLAMRDLDSKLLEITRLNGYRYTRYADDLVFSGLHESPSEEIRAQIKAEIEADGWRLASEKEYFAVRPKRLKVHGILVDSLVPRLTRGYRNKLRAYRHMLQNASLSDVDRKRLQGHVDYADSVDRYFISLRKD